MTQQRLRRACHRGSLIAVAIAHGCSIEPDCRETRTCPTAVSPDTDAGEAGSAPIASEGGAAGAGGSTSGAARGMDAGAAGAAPTGAGVGAACDETEGTRKCPEPASDSVLVCITGKWALHEQCATGTLCDSSEPGCAPIAEGCDRLAPGDAYCEGKIRQVCGPDLVTRESEPCEGRCVNGECVGISCGDGALQDDEECDDGNTTDTDECTSSCEKAVCGDGFVFARDEACDDGNRSDFDDCTATCERARCGDGIVNERAEECDDANTINTDDCLDTCDEARCGDGFIQEDVEQCEDGNADDGDDCPTNCRQATCGDGFLWREHERCDDGNPVRGDGCNPACVAEPTQIALGGNHSCAVFGDGRLKCWGDNSYNQVDESSDSGVGDRTSEIGTNLKTRLTGVTSVAAGATHTCAIQLGQVKCWGDNRNRQLSPSFSGDFSAMPVDVKLNDSKPISVCAGDGWSAVLLQNGAVLTWGALLPDAPNALNPAGFSANVEAIECSDNWICARIADSGVPECAGVWPDRDPGRYELDAYGVSGNASAEPVTDISAGLSHGCALNAAGVVRCWGSGETGALMVDPGQSSWVFPEAGSASPISQIGPGAPRSVAGGGGVSCVVYTDGSLRCWGTNTTGVLGQPGFTSGGNYLGDDPGELGDRLNPINLGNGVLVETVATSGSHACALLRDGGIKCWGNNAQGQLAIGTSDDAIGDDLGEMGDLLRYASID